MTETLASWHPFIVHFSLSLTIISAGFDVADFFANRKRFRETGFMLMILAVPALLLAALTGNLAADGVREARALLILDKHQTYANIAIWTFCAAGMWRTFLHFRNQYIGIRKVVYVFVVTAAAMSVFLAGIQGGAIRHRDPAPDGPGRNVLLHQNDNPMRYTENRIFFAGNNTYTELTIRDV